MEGLRRVLKCPTMVEKPRVTLPSLDVRVKKAFSSNTSPNEIIHCLFQKASARKSPQPCNQWLEESYPKVRKVIPMHAKRSLQKVCSLGKSKIFLK